MKYLVKFETGDPSVDGHNEYDVYYYNTSVSKEELDKAYIASMVLTGLKFDTNSWYNSEFAGRDSVNVFVEYGESWITEQAESILKSFNAPLDDLLDFEEDRYRADYQGGMVVELLLWFIGLSIEFEYEKVELGIPTFGYSVGYGVYGDY